MGKSTDGSRSPRPHILTISWQSSPHNLTMEFHGLWLPWPASSPVAATPSERHTTTGLLHGDYTNMMETLGLGQPFLVRLAPPTVQVLLPWRPNRTSPKSRKKDEQHQGATRKRS
ncbi:hypothetical protein VPH35_036990 [Triticum aestivum]